MRIAVFTEVFLPKTDGITNRLRYTLRCFRKLGQEVLVFAPDTAASIYAGIRVVRIPGLPFPAYPGLRVSLPEPSMGSISYGSGTTSDTRSYGKPLRGPRGGLMEA